MDFCYKRRSIGALIMSTESYITPLRKKGSGHARLSLNHVKQLQQHSAICVCALASMKASCCSVVSSSQTQTDAGAGPYRLRQFGSGYMRLVAPCVTQLLDTIKTSQYYCSVIASIIIINVRKSYNMI